jgi:hypothetical protein
MAETLSVQGPPAQHEEADADTATRKPSHAPLAESEQARAAFLVETRISWRRSRPGSGA